MASVNHTRSMSSSLPTLADIHRRCTELLDWQKTHPRQAGDDDPPEDSFDLEDAYLEEAFALDRRFEAPEDPAPSSAFAPEPSAPPLPTLPKPALDGLAGLVLRSLAPNTEADPAAILLQFLAAFGNLVGPGPHCIVGNTRHGLNLFVVLVGESSKARKGTSWRQIAGLFSQVDPLWTSRRISTARPTANGLVFAVRDQQPVTDRRLFVLSEEFASVLHVLGQRTGQLSPLLRCAWDGGDLSAGSERHLLQATRPHISMVGHVTQGELAHHLSRTESHNGFANRCLWAGDRRSHPLPDGGSLPPEQLTALSDELRRCLNWVQSQTGLLFCRTEAARELWNDCYPTLSEGRQDAFGAATSRAEAQVLRLSAIYAALDCSPLVEACHLLAALAVWDYCQASARLFFDATPVDPILRRISQALTASPAGGLSKTQIGVLFHGHVSIERIDRALAELTSLGLISCATQAGRGRPSTLWAPVQDRKAANL
jgi:hypothetical protein